MFEEMKSYLEERRQDHMDTFHDKGQSRFTDELRMDVEKAGHHVPGYLDECFRQARVFRCLPDQIKSSPEELRRYFEHSCRFGNLDERTIYGEMVTIPESLHANGKLRRSEEGRRIDLDAVRLQGVDPKYVLYFRVSQPSEEAKPEYYWTSDYVEVCIGLRAEISPDQRKDSVVLISTLEAIHENGGLIRDINDDCGIAVRQISLSPFPKDLILGQFRSMETE